MSEEKQLFYCCELSDIILQLSEIFTHELKELNLYDLFNSVEMPLLKVLSKMELEGINLDVQMLKSYSIELSEEILSIEKQIYKLSGESLIFLLLSS